MRISRLIVPILIAVAGYALLARLSSQQPASGFGYVLDRTEAINRARIEAKQRGIDADSWRAGVETQVQGNSAIYLKNTPHPALKDLLSPIAVEATLSEPSTGRRFFATLAADGRLLGFRRREPQPDGINLSAEQAEQLAESSLADIAGDRRSDFVRRTAPPSTGESRTFSWEMIAPDESRVKVTLDVVVTGGRIMSVSLNPAFSPVHLEQQRKARQPLNTVSVFFPILIAATLLVAFICYMLHIVRKEVRHRSTLIFLAATFVLMSLWGINGEIHEDLFTDLTGAPPFGSVLLGYALSVLLISLINSLFIAPFFVMFAAGFPYAVHLPKNPLNTIELILRGKAGARMVGRSLFTGLSLGWIVPVVPLAVSAYGRLEYPALRPGSLADAFNASFPTLSPPTDFATIQLFTVFSVFAFLYPLIARFVRRSAVVRLLVVVVAAAGLTAATPFQISMTGMFLGALLQAIAFEAIIYRVDVLSAVTALIAGDFAAKLCVYASQPSPSLQSSGWRGWAALVILAAGAAVLAFRGRETSEEEHHLLWVNEAQRANRVERERLKAEFEVARRAQQQMLPDKPPSAPGLDISAHCRPAREVGGDLYDFLDLPDGRLGIVVADVSGKGVPASLYMTLTKGLLASVSETTSDPGAILHEVNRHLYIACRKKMFVTLLLAVFDPHRRTLTYARAGHNPPVLRRNRAGETTLLKAPGIGLGLNGGDLFKRTMKVESASLEAQDLLILYSDGITEAMNEQREEYGEERLMELAARLDSISAEGVKDAVLNDVGAFLGRVPPQDDQTIVVVRVL